jgi:3-hydroxymyristoyl/3-hydroxydecanoyl-(acyl carrier protein) dehydratase
MSVEIDAVIDSSHPALPGHFPGNPIVPAVVLLERVAAAIEDAYGPQARLVRLPAVKFLAPLAPGERFRIVLERQNASVIRFTLVRGGKPFAVGNAEIGV